MGSFLKRPRSAIREFLSSEASGGLLLMAAAALALIVANSPLANAYDHALHSRLGPFSLHKWINDAAMSLFFLLVGLEIKREFVDGHLSSWADRRLPVVAALGGMAVPALVYLAVAAGEPGLARGWAIPAATDIAFAIGVISLLGSRVPASLKLFLTTVAIVDDLGAVVIIALAYTASISGPWLLAALLVMGLMFLGARAGVQKMRWYFLGFILLWLAVFQSGVHATVAGVLAAMMVPLRPTPSAPDAEDSTLHRMEHVLQRPVAWLIVPLFGFANAGVSLGNVEIGASLPLAIALGLFAGKQIGIFSAVWLCVRTGLAVRPAKASWTQVYGVSLLCGIGFTMSLFIGGLAFADPAMSDGVKIGVLAGSLCSALAGYAVLRWVGPR
ncbi:MAG: Na+/H+ antiporter NhaA [Sphingomonadales bacterium]|nr:Na+/H+ antiporter NhaA [Sphingomonadales bacterium]